MAHIHSVGTVMNGARRAAQCQLGRVHLHTSPTSRALLGKMRQALTEARPATRAPKTPQTSNINDTKPKALPAAVREADRPPARTTGSQRTSGSQRKTLQKVPEGMVVEDHQPAGPEVWMPKVFGTIEQPVDAEIAKFVVIGAANSGKSTLVNRLTGAQVSVVSERPQTTRTRIMAAATVGSKQLVFLDTPGIVSRNALRRVSRTVVTSPWLTLGEADFAILLLDAYKLTQKSDAVERYLFAQLEKNSTIPAIFVVNKIDLVQDQEKLAEKIKEYMAKYPFIVNGPLFISALGNTNVDELKALLLSKTKPGDWVVPAHASSDMSDMLRVEELIRVQWFTQLTGYLPYVVRQRNVGWEEVSVPQPPMTIYTDATSDGGNTAVLQSHVETRSTKELIIKQELIVTSAGEAKILLGKSGSKIKDIGRDAANNIAKALGIPTRLHLQVLVEPDSRSRK
ncbi:hypothetical protein GGI13_007961 [Coemansia sp. RSA 455]|nr:hypothetical protein GGI13_007961 [Coemansia sp. RSA 455]